MSYYEKTLTWEFFQNISLMEYLLLTDDDLEVYKKLCIEKLGHYVELMPKLPEGDDDFGPDFGV